MAACVPISEPVFLITSTFPFSDTHTQHTHTHTHNTHTHTHTQNHRHKQYTQNLHKPALNHKFSYLFHTCCSSSSRRSLCSHNCTNNTQLTEAQQNRKISHKQHCPVSHPLSLHIQSPSLWVTDPPLPGLVPDTALDAIFQPRRREAATERERGPRVRGAAPRAVAGSNWKYALARTRSRVQRWRVIQSRSGHYN